MICPIEAGAGQIIHAGINNDKLLTALLGVQNLCNKNPGIPHYNPARLKDQGTVQTFHLILDSLGICSRQRWIF